MVNKCATACLLHKNNRSRSMPNRQQGLNDSSSLEGAYQPPPRKSGHCCNRKRRKSCHTRSQRIQPNQSGFCGDSQRQNPPDRSPADVIAALTAQAYNTYKQTYSTKELASNNSGRDDTVLEEGEDTGCIPDSQNFVPQQQNLNQNWNQINPYQSIQQPTQNNYNQNPMNVTVRLKQGENPYNPGKVVWNSANQPGQEYCQNEGFDFWAGNNQFRVRGDQGNWNSNMFSGLQQQAFYSQIENLVNDSGKDTCITSPVELAMQVQPKQRFRAGGGGSFCPKNSQQGKGSQDCSTCPNSTPQPSQTTDCPSCGGVSNAIEPRLEDIQSAMRGQVASPGQDGGQQRPTSLSFADGGAPKKSDSENRVSSSPSSTKGKKSSRFEFTSPDSLRNRLQQYIHNLPQGPNPEKLKPFAGGREDALSCRTCYTPVDELTLPAPCQPCGRLEMTAKDFEDEECAAKRKVEEAKAAAEKEKIMAEVACYKSLMPLDLTCGEQIQYLQCLGASEKAINAFKELQQEGIDKMCNKCPSAAGATASSTRKSNVAPALQQPGGVSPSQPSDSFLGPSNSTKQDILQQMQNVQNTPLPDPAFRKSVLAHQVMSSSQRRRMSTNPAGGPPITPIAEETEQNQLAVTGAGPSDLAQLLQQCRDELGVSNFAGQPTGYMQQPDNMQQIVDDDARLYQRLSQTQGGLQFQNNGTPFNCPPPPPCPDPAGGGDEANDDDEEPDLSMFGAAPVIAERSLKDSMIMYRLHLANIRRRYFGEVVKFIDEVENITPEVAAAMVFTEDEGRSLKVAPQKMYEYLYPESPCQPLVTIGDVTKDLPPGYDDIVVPLVPPMFLVSRDFPALEDPAMLDSPRVIQVGPAMNLADEPMTTETKGATDVAELVTGITENQAVGLGDDEDEDGEEVEFEDVFNVKLPVTMPPHYCRMQIRGSQAPNWFPGYYIALQSKPGVNVNDSHGTILEQVWQDVQPDAVRPGGGAIIIGQ